MKQKWLDGIIFKQDIFGLKNLDELLKVGDVIYVKLKNKNQYEIKQEPEIDGGIVVMDLTQEVISNEWRFSFKK